MRVLDQRYDARRALDRVRIRNTGEVFGFDSVREATETKSNLRSICDALFNAEPRDLSAH